MSPGCGVKADGVGPVLSRAWVKADGVGPVLSRAYSPHPTEEEFSGFIDKRLDHRVV